MKVLSVFDREFKIYGQVLEGYDFTEVLQKLEQYEVPSEGIVYKASVLELEECEAFSDLRDRGFGGMPIQLGYCNGVNNKLNCLEYHKSSEINIAGDDIVLFLGLLYEIEEGMFDTSYAKAFCIPKGFAVELYGTTLHYAPCGFDGKEFRMACALPKGTNVGKVDTIAHKTKETNMYLGNNKWLLAHPESNEAKSGSYIGITGENISYFFEQEDTNEQTS